MIDPRNKHTRGTKVGPRDLWTRCHCKRNPTRVNLARFAELGPQAIAQCMRCGTRWPLPPMIERAARKGRAP